jgi:hypothetical protein
MNKVIDIFHFDGQEDLLKVKFEHTTNFVDEYWVIDDTPERKLKNVIYNNFDGIIGKINILTYINTDYHNQLLVNILVEEKVPFDAIIILSAIDEIYTQEVISRLDLYLPFGPHVLSVVESNYSLEPTTNEELWGPVVFYRTNYVIKEQPLKVLLDRIKKLNVDPKWIIKNGGYKLTKKENNIKYKFVLD